MKKSVSRTLAMALATCMAAGTLAACGSGSGICGRFQRS